jgi:hypothetical protein
MEPIRAGDLVKVKTGGPEIDGIVADVLKGGKVVVAVIDRVRGPVLRTVPGSALAEREAGADDRALQLLVRRSSPATRGGARAGAGGAGRGRAGHTRAAMHRTTGK